MKTAVEQLIERIEKQMSAIPNEPNLTERALYDSYLNCKKWATELLEKEKEQIQKSYKDHHDLGHIYGLDTEQYYNQTYNQNK